MVYDFLLTGVSEVPVVVFVGATVTKLFQTGGAYTQKFSACDQLTCFCMSESGLQLIVNLFSMFCHRTIPMTTVLPLQVVQSGGKNIELAIMRNGETLKVNIYLSLTTSKWSLTLHILHCKTVPVHY